MSICDNCLKVKDIPSCVESLTVGVIANALTPIIVYVKNISTGKITSFLETSQGDGTVKFNPNGWIVPENSFEIWVTLAGATDTSTRLDLTIGDDVAECLSVRSNKVYNTQNIRLSYEVIKLTV